MSTPSPMPWHWDVAKVIAGRSLSVEQIAAHIAMHDPQPEESQSLRESHATLLSVQSELVAALQYYAGAPWVGHVGGWAYSDIATRANDALAKLEARP